MDAKPATEQIVSWMRAHLDQEISMEEMAEKAGVSPFHFLRTFRRWTGVTPALFLSALRLEEAKRLLLTTDRSVTDICFDVGYNSLGTFTTRFTQLVGLSPARLRRLGSGFRLEALTLEVERLSAGTAITGGIGTTAILGTLAAGEPPPGLIFVGLFHHALPQQRPLACTLLTAPGPFRLNAPKPGRYHLFAACFAHTSEPLDFLLSSRSVRQVAASGPVYVRTGDSSAGPVELRLRSLGPLDPPLLVALPLLVAERHARTTLREPEEVIRRVSAG
ncbi:MAG TPA: AraC family transcriptional regulator [Thermoanaerobaculia bacterium]|jgi:AraC-like DNA-binding protein|nr:AraC family transcriptional regulator [Thermoanaerobaculia bacterium]